MTDSRKVLESIPEPASLDRTMPAPRAVAEEGKNLGGITQTADSALRGGNYAATRSTPAGGSKNQDAGSKSASSATKPHDQSSSADDEAIAADEKTPDDESALESLGRAIGAPLSGEAAEKEPRR